MPALRKPASRPSSTVPGLASRVISGSSSIRKCRASASRIRSMVAGSKSEGVPPPKKTVSNVTESKGGRSQNHAISAARASA